MLDLLIIVSYCSYCFDPVSHMIWVTWGGITLCCIYIQWTSERYHCAWYPLAFHWLLSLLSGCVYAQTEWYLSDFSSCDHNHLMTICATHDISTCRLESAPDLSFAFCASLLSSCYLTQARSPKRESGCGNSISIPFFLRKYALRPLLWPS